MLVCICVCFFFFLHICVYVCVHVSRLVWCVPLCVSLCVCFPLLIEVDRAGPAVRIIPGFVERLPPRGSQYWRVKGHLLNLAPQGLYG
jgi:hypothetical protein